MTFKNSVKLLCANFATVWKLLVFNVLSIGVCFGLLAIWGGFYLDVAKAVSAQVGLADVFSTGTLYFSSISGALTTIINFVTLFFVAMFGQSVGAGVFFCFVVFMLFPFLLSMGKIVTCELIYGYMSSCQKQSFTATFLKTLKTSVPYSALKVLHSLPFNFLSLLSVWALTRISFVGLDMLFPFVFVLVLALALAFKELINAGWAPASVVYNYSASKSYRVGMRATFRRSGTVFSTAFIICLLLIVLSLVLGLYSLIIILPIAAPFLSIFEMVAFFSSQGMRFYVDGENIVSPKKLEEVDKLEDAKYLL